MEEAKDDDTTTQKILDNIPPGVLRGYLVRHKGDTFIVLGAVLKSAGLHIFRAYYKREDIDGLVKNAGIPLVLVPVSRTSREGYHVVLIRDEQRITDVLNSEVGLQRFKRNFCH